METTRLIAVLWVLFTIGIVGNFSFFLWSREVRQARLEYPEIFQVKSGFLADSATIEADEKLRYSYRFVNIGKRKIPAKTFIVMLETTLEQPGKWKDIESPLLKSGGVLNCVQEFDFTTLEDCVYYVGVSFYFNVRVGIATPMHRKGISKIIIKNQKVVSIENYEAGLDWENAWEELEQRKRSSRLQPSTKTG